MSNKTRKHIWPVSLVMSMAIVLAVLAAFPRAGAHRSRPRRPGDNPTSLGELSEPQPDDVPHRDCAPDPQTDDGQRQRATATTDGGHDAGRHRRRMTKSDSTSSSGATRDPADHQSLNSMGWMDHGRGVAPSCCTWRTTSRSPTPSRQFGVWWPRARLMDRSHHRQRRPGVRDQPGRKSRPAPTSTPTRRTSASGCWCPTCVPTPPRLRGPTA